jgi:hypothetical protein
VQQTFVLHTQNSATFVLRTQKSLPKSRPKKVSKKVDKKASKKQQERRQKSLFLNLSCCCLETGLKPFLFSLFVPSKLQSKQVTI